MASGSQLCLAFNLTPTGPNDFPWQRDAVGAAVGKFLKIAAHLLCVETVERRLHRFMVDSLKSLCRESAKRRPEDCQLDLQPVVHEDESFLKRAGSHIAIHVMEFIIDFVTL